MGKSIVTIVMDALIGAGIRTERAMPGRQMPDIQSPVAAVQLEGLDQTAGTATVRITALTPARLGAQSCEDLAVSISGVLQGLGGSCKQGMTGQLNGTTLLQTPVSAEFVGFETANGWGEPPEVVEPVVPTFSVTVGDVVLTNAVAFTAYRATDDTVTEFADTQWHWRIEELFSLDEPEETIPQEPFTITVSRTGRTETYTGCTLTFHRRSVEAENQSQIREGWAESMTVS